MKTGCSEVSRRVVYVVVMVRFHDLRHSYVKLGLK